MQTWQIFPILIIGAVFVYSVFLRKKIQQGNHQSYADGLAKLTADFAGQRRAGETDPALVVAMTRSMFKIKMFYVGLTNQRLFLAEYGQPASRAFDRGPGLTLAIKRKTFSDQGNMQVTYSDGWEAKVSLPGGESHVWRLYEQMDGHPGQAEHLGALLRTAGAC